MTYADLPTLNAVLNSISGALLVAGYVFVRSGNVRAHRACMLAAFGVSTLFLVSYLIYHAEVGSVRYTGQGWARPVYFTILITHIILAAAIVPMVIMTLSRGLRGQIERHRKIARWTFPLWLYVSVTGVIVYAMLYGIG